MQRHSYVKKIKFLSEEQKRIIEPLSHGPQTEHEFPTQSLIFSNQVLKLKA